MIRARTALENEFIEPAVSGKHLINEILQKKATDVIDLLTQKKLKKSWDPYFEKYMSEKI